MQFFGVQTKVGLIKEQPMKRSLAIVVLTAMFLHGRSPQGDVIRINSFVRVVPNTSNPLQS